MPKSKKIFFLTVFVVIIVLILFGRKEPKGELIPLQEAENLIWVLSDTAGMTADFKTEDDQRNEYLTFSQLLSVIDQIGDCGWQCPEYYRKNDFVLKEDWYAFFDAARIQYDKEGRIQDKEITVLGIEEKLIAADQEYSFRTEYIRPYLYQKVVVVQKEGIIYSVREMTDDEISLENVWVMGKETDQYHIFYNGYENIISEENAATKKLDQNREQVADLYFSKGKLTDVQWNTEKINGKLLKVTEAYAEVEGYGSIPFSEAFQAYRIYGTLQNYQKNDLKIGYDFTDFIIQDEKIQAALVTREENMESIRVLIRNNDFAGSCHTELELQSESDLRITAGIGMGTETSVTWPAGELLKITADSELFDGGKVRIEPLVNTGKIFLMNLKRNHGNPGFRGSFELERNEDGIVLINEVLLEEYLYAVVPSEMPASYSLEALKAQAVTARTYAYQKMLHAGLPALGAHLDDSSSYQVYNNIEEQLETNRAVRETKGELLCYSDELAQTYYYSTSCGYGSGADVWSGSDGEIYPYLGSKAVSWEEIPDEEEPFSEFIRKVRESDFECREAWYRWKYQADEIDSERMLDRLKERYDANPALVLKAMDDGKYISEKPDKLGEILDIRILSRKEGGTIGELLIEGERETYLVKTEYNIRAVLNDGKTSVVRMDGSSWFSEVLLPSAFFDLETVTDGGKVVGYILYGGGFGHGVGMSQNGARNMAEYGYDYEKILAFFYEGCSIKAAY